MFRWLRDRLNHEILTSDQMKEEVVASLKEQIAGMVNGERFYGEFSDGREWSLDMHNFKVDCLNFGDFKVTEV